MYFHSKYKLCRNVSEIFIQNTNYAATFNVLINVDIYAFTLLYYRNNYVFRMRRYSRNILQWNKTNTKNIKINKWRLLLFGFSIGTDIYNTSFKN